MKLSKFCLKYFLLLLCILLVLNIAIFTKIIVKNTNLQKVNKVPDNNSSVNNTYGEIIISKNDPALGLENAKVTVILFSDFLCPFCAAYSGESKELTTAAKKQFPSWQPPFPNVIFPYIQNGTVRLFWKDLPLHGEEAVRAHIAARCAYEQNKFWEFHNLLFALHDSKNKQPFSKDNLKRLAQKLKLNTQDFNTCLDSEKYKTFMEKALENAKSLNIYNTPTAYINGLQITGIDYLSQIKLVIEQELKKTR